MPLAAEVVEAAVDGADKTVDTATEEAVEVMVTEEAAEATITKVDIIIKEVTMASMDGLREMETISEAAEAAVEVGNEANVLVTCRSITLD